MKTLAELSDEIKRCEKDLSEASLERFVRQLELDKLTIEDANKTLESWIRVLFENTTPNDKGIRCSTGKGFNILKDHYVIGKHIFFVEHVDELVLNDRKFYTKCTGLKFIDTRPTGAVLLAIEKLGIKYSQGLLALPCW